jgi:hypothetical protein
MARAIVLSLDGEVSRFAITRVTRDKIYGRKKRIVVDAEDNECSPGLLTVDGATVLGSGATASLYIDDDFNSVERSDLTPVDPATGEQLPTLPSTLDVEQPLTGPAALRHFLDHTTTSIYELDPEEFGAKLLAALEKGEIYEARFNYSQSLDDSPLFVLKNEAGIFALVAKATRFEVCRPNIPLPQEDDEDDSLEDDDLDFGMF